MLRFNLIKQICDKFHCKLCVVGDDYQAIYRFQGCDLNLFLNFKEYFSNSKIYFLNETFRNSQELIDVAGYFINKNLNQINKKLTSKKHLDNPIIIKYYLDEKNILMDVIKTIDINKEILIISRNNFDLKKYVNNYQIINNDLYIKGIKHKLKFMTIHSSKGLESDIVIILNMSNDKYGMPSKVKDDDILSLIKNDSLYEYDEERRLFYVALTRTKSYVYLLTPFFNQSIFIKEIKKLCITQF